MYRSPQILIDSTDPIQSCNKGTVWKAGGGKAGFKASYESITVSYYPENDTPSRFIVKAHTPIGSQRIGAYGSKDCAVEAAIQYGKKYMSQTFNLISDL